jgi:hypothetical protein
MPLCIVIREKRRMIYGCGDMTPQHNSCGQYSQHFIDWRHDESLHVESIWGIRGLHGRFHGILRPHLIMCTFR